MSGRKRTHTCGELGLDTVGQHVVLMGWVETVRDLGGLIFIDLRDREGVTQILVNPEAGASVVETAKRVGSEWVIAVGGGVLERAKETVNPNIATGQIEVSASELEVLSEAKTPPFEIEEDSKASEDLRLRYRYLDLRRSSVRRRIEIRSEIGFAARRHLQGGGFLEIETPYLTKSTPEGARDYLVPSRVHKGSFYALPQSPQLFKQLLMIGGIEKYFQIVRCFRDEDLRADRQPEFTQIDIEMSFIDREDIFTLVEGLFVDMLNAVDIEVEIPFPRLTHDEAVARFGTDKPDTRFGCEIVDLSEQSAGSGYTVFEDIIEKGGVVRALLFRGCARYSRKELDLLQVRAKELGAAGLGWARWTDEEIKSPLLRNIKKERLEKFFQTAGGGRDDLLLVVAGEPVLASTVLGTLRIELAKREGLIPSGREMSLLWVTDFPYFVISKSEGRLEAMHHPFTSPHPDDLDLLDGNQTKVRSLAYDLVANGYELGGGSMRIHRIDWQEKIFQALGLTEGAAKEKFGFFLEALQYGAPPHGGIALGLDRIAMLAAGATSLRGVIAFPKTTSAYDLMTGSPSEVTSNQLSELGIGLTPAKRGRQS